jgi:putative DNA methylase
MGARLLAVVGEGGRGRIYLAPTEEMERIAHEEKPVWRPEQKIGGDRRALWTPLYGLETFADLFTDRQLVALNTFCDLVKEARERVINDSVKAGLENDGIGIDAGGTGVTAYGDAVATYLAFVVDRLANRQSTICFWDNSRENIQQTFTRQAIPMTWDFVEGNPFSSSTGNFTSECSWVYIFLSKIIFVNNGYASLSDVISNSLKIGKVVFTTDPPYYDNIGYADLSDFFYVLLRRNLKPIYPELFKTLLVPKSKELVATSYRFEGDKKKAERFFEDGMKKAFRVMYENHKDGFPLSIYYAFKQAEKKLDGTMANTGWETMLQALVTTGFQVLGTWPVRTEYTGNLKKTINALASSIVLVCRKREPYAPVTTRGRFIEELHKNLAFAVKTLQEANIPPVDIQQAAIGPGMSVYSKYSEIREASGTMRIHDALVLINQHLDDILGEDESDYDDYTRWAVSWFEQFGTKEGDYGTAENLTKAKVVSVKGMVDAGFLFAHAGKVRLLRRDELEANWSPQRDSSFTIWETTQHLVGALQNEGEDRAAEIYNELSADHIESAKQLCYRLFNTCEQKGWAQEAQGYNALIASFPSISEKARNMPRRPRQQTML